MTTNRARAQEDEMATSERRKKAQQAKKGAKEARMKRPGARSVYALKKRGIYPPNSPYRTIWAGGES